MLRSATPARRDGTVSVVVAVALIAMLAATALSLDGGNLLDKRRQCQAAADSAAYAAVCELYSNWSTLHGLDDADGTAVTVAKAAAKANGYEDGVDGCTVEVYIPPRSGPFAGQKAHAEVIINHTQQRYFSKLWGSDSIPYGARAVARGSKSTVNNGIIVLDPSQKGSFQTGGGGLVTVGGTASVIVNSNDPQAMIANGGGSVAAPQYDVTGSPGYATPGGGSFLGTINSGVEPTPDPLRFIPPPDPNTMQIQSTKKLQYSQADTITLKPGVYQGGISISGKTNIILQPGIYYMQGGGFSWGGQGTLTGNGVMIYNDPLSTSDKLTLTGLGNCYLTPMTSGPYQGILLFQNRTATAPVNVSGSGTGSMYITGTFYAAGAELSVTGNGTQDTIGSQYISNTLVLGGNGNFNVNWDPSLVPGIRQLWLVE